MGTIANSSAPLDLPASGPTPHQDRGFWRWFRGFLEEELSPYPGRISVVARMVIAATLTMYLIMTFRLPGAAVGAYYTLLLSRDSPRTTLRSAFNILVAYLVCVAYCMLGILLFIDEPLTHFLLVVVSLFVSFYIIKVCTDYTSAAAFAFSIAIVIPLWDSPAPTGLLVTATLWAVGSVAIGLGVTVAIEYVFHIFENRDPLVEGVVDRLAVVSEVLSQCCGHPIRSGTQRRIEQYGTVGVSRLRRLASPTFTPQRYVFQRSTVVSLTGRLVDLANTILHLPVSPNTEDSERLRRLGYRINALRKLLTHGRHLEHFQPAGHAAKSAYPLLPELERTVRLLTVALTQAGPDQPELRTEPEPPKPIFLPDAFSNPDHLLFSLRGCLAASICYVLLNAAAWPGLSTSLATCMVTALSTVGSSRQKQMLRLTGAVIGGVFFGIGSQALILPMLDGIGGFTILFLALTIPAAWISTASPRLSYLGLQMALAFYLIHLQEFAPQTNLAVGRDRVFGVLLGLIAMWLIFDQLGTRPAAEEIRSIFARNLRLLAELADPWPAGREPLNEASLARLREQILNNFAAVNQQADAVLLEVGHDRREHLRLRDQVRSWQPNLRSLFVVETALLQYRLQPQPQHIAPPIVQAQRALDEEIRRDLLLLADRFEHGTPSPAGDALDHRYAALEQAIYATYTDPLARARAVLSLSSHLVEILKYLVREI